MILKNKESQVLKKLEMRELEDLMSLQKHFTFTCGHGITEERIDPNGSIPLTVCLICEKEIYK